MVYKATWLLSTSMVSTLAMVSVNLTTPESMFHTSTRLVRVQGRVRVRVRVRVKGER